MKKTLALFCLFAGASASAHVEPGTYVGTTDAGARCEMTALGQYFENNTPHPLNERVKVRVGADEYTLGHPPVISVAESKASFNHDFFHGILPLPTGARALVIDMSHAEGHEGPTAFHVIDHQWRNDVRTATNCANLQFVAPPAATATAMSVTSAYPILDRYEALAKKLIGMTETARTADERTVIATETRELIRQGAEIMNLYASKNPKCAAQFAPMIAEIPSMEGMTVDQLHSKYHDGVGLPAAPKHCYFGRSQVVHPMMNLVRLKGAWSDAVKADVLDEYQEVIEHLARIQKNLDNPPQ